MAACRRVFFRSAREKSSESLGVIFLPKFGFLTPLFFFFSPDQVGALLSSKASPRSDCPEAPNPSPFHPFGMSKSRARGERDGGGAATMTPPSSPPPPPPPPPPLSPTSPSSTSTSDACSSPPSSSSASSAPLRRRLFALGSLFQKVAASPLSPIRSSQAAPLKHVASESWEDADNNEDHLDELDVSALSPEELFAPATAVDECLVSSLLLPPVSSPPAWHQLPAHILELIVESSLLPENELTMPWKERAVSSFFVVHLTSSKKRSGIQRPPAASEVFPTTGPSARSDYFLRLRWRGHASISPSGSRKGQKGTAFGSSDGSRKGIETVPHSFFDAARRRRPFFALDDFASRPLAASKKREEHPGIFLTFRQNQNQNQNQNQTGKTTERLHLRRRLPLLARRRGGGGLGPGG